MQTVMEASRPSKLKRALEKGNKKGLLKNWSEQMFFTLFVFDQKGVERPVSVPYGAELAMLVTLKKEEAEGLSASVEGVGELARPHIKSVPLWELARLACSDGCVLAWAKEGIVFERVVLLLLGYTALITSQDGSDSYYSINPIPLEGEGAKSLAPGRLQRWSVNSGSEEGDSWLVYDDSQNWSTNPYLPELPDNAVPASSLSSDERLIYDRWASPCLEGEIALQEQAAAGDEIALPGDGAIDQDYLTGPKRIYSLIEQYLFPNRKNLKLEVQPTTITPIVFDEQGKERQEEPIDAVKFVFQYIEQSSYGAAIAPQRIHEETLTLDDLERMPYKLPTAPGLHPLPAALQRLLKRHLGWGIFALSRRLEGGFYFFEGRLRHLLTALPDNSERRFFSDPDDERFPFLAGFRCGEEMLPVMVLGMQGGHYVCNPLQDLEVPEERVPAEMPLRDDLVVGGSMALWDLGGSIRIPPALIDFPEAWYKGMRVSAEHMVIQARNSLALYSYALRSDKEPEKADSESDVKELLKWLGIGGIIFVFILMLL